MKKRLPARPGRLAAIGACALLALAGGAGLHGFAASPALTVTYGINYNGLVALEVGRATVQYSMSGSGYQLVLSFRPSSSARSLSVGPATMRTTGTVAPHGLKPLAATLDYAVRSLAEERSFTFAGDRLQAVRIVKKKSRGLFKDSTSVAYDPRTLPAYAPMSEADQRNVLDPLSAMFLPVVGQNALDPENCARRVRIYDGRRRFDIALSYRGTERAALGGGEALLCSAAYVPIAGQSVDGDEFTEDLRDYKIAVSLVPASGTSFLIPARISLTDRGGAPVAEAHAIAIAAR